jgi:hypothetical protein
MICCINMVKVNAMQKYFVISSTYVHCIANYRFWIQLCTSFVLDFVTTIMVGNVTCDLYITLVIVFVLCSSTSVIASDVTGDLTSHESIVVCDL